MYPACPRRGGVNVYVRILCRRTTKNSKYLKQKDFREGDWIQMTQEHLTRTSTTCWRVADDLCTDEGTRRRETQRHGRRYKKSRKQGEKARKSLLKASIVTSLPVSATKPSREPCHISAVFFLILLTTVSSVTTAAVESPLRAQINEMFTFIYSSNYDVNTHSI